MLRVGPKARQGREDDAMSEFVSTNLNGGEELWSRHRLAEFSNEIEM